MPPIAPMLAKATREIPGGMLYEPKWDGFRSIVFRDGDEVEIGSRNERPMTRYFPEVAAAIRASLPERCVVDGEIVVPAGQGLDFWSLQQRLHPAASRVAMLAEATPARFIAFDLLALGDDDYTRRPFHERRAALETALAAAAPPIHLTPITRDRELARRWFELFEGAGLDGLIAKARRRHLPAGQARDGQDQARAHRRLRGGRLPRAQVRPGRRSARCCSASTATRRRCPPSGCRYPAVSPRLALWPRSRWHAGASCSRSSSRW